MKPKSDNLFHFTKSLNVLKLILKTGIQPKYCLEDFKLFPEIPVDYVGFPVCCFCDIPLSRISQHTDFYGNYGIGLTKSWGLLNKLNPVIYCTESSPIIDIAKHLSFDKDKSSDKSYKLVSLLKPIEGNMLMSGEIIEKEFYQENEWRYVPDVAPENQIIEDYNYDEEREDGNKYLEQFSLEFSPSDIRYVFVKKDTDIPEIVDFIMTELASFPLNDLKILQSRIVSLETLSIDL